MVGTHNPTFTLIATVGAILVVAWAFHELACLIRQLIWNWIDDTHHPIDESALLKRLKKMAKVESDDNLEASLIVAVCLMMWPVGLGIAYGIVYLHRRRAARRLEKVNNSGAVVALSVDTFTERLNHVAGSHQTA
ncbi:hypothetical protein [Pseudomonas fluorescens]|uniref:hypothetical protein n=1 Tax=Pseudomonas fluorescens TaxID=294 RepID=UPI001A9E78BE|nr:hypothetical protein [Pseudomonas fluorescens]QTD31617.1 hypothetical protein JZM58_20275 [Pseudomonas fluorescens]